MLSDPDSTTKFGAPVDFRRLSSRGGRTWPALPVGLGEFLREKAMTARNPSGGLIGDVLALRSNSLYSRATKWGFRGEILEGSSAGRAVSYRAKLWRADAGSGLSHVTGSLLV